MSQHSYLSQPSLPPPNPLSSIPSTHTRMRAKAQVLAKDHITLRGDGYSNMEKPPSREEVSTPDRSRRPAPAAAPPSVGKGGASLPTVSELVHLASCPNPPPRVALLCWAVTTALGPAPRGPPPTSEPPGGVAWPGVQRCLIRSSDLLGRLRSFDRAAAPDWRVRVLSMGLRHADAEWEEAGARREGFRKLGLWLRETMRTSPVPALMMPMSGAVVDVDVDLDDAEELVNKAPSPANCESEKGPAASPSDSPSASPSDSPRRLQLDEDSSVTGESESDSDRSASSSDRSASSPTGSGSERSGSPPPDFELTFQCVDLDRLLLKATPRVTPRVTPRGEPVQVEEEAEPEPVAKLQQWLMFDPAHFVAERERKKKMSPPKSPPPKRKPKPMPPPSMPP
ncbi:hypothetical protein TeGR_g14471, partial [Tetraparma gracilis]